MYDYKPRIEWVNAEMVRGRKRRRKLTCASLMVLAIGVFGLTFSMNHTDPTPAQIPKESSISFNTPLELDSQPKTDNQKHSVLHSHQQQSEPKNKKIIAPITSTSKTRQSVTSDNESLMAKGLPFEPNLNLTAINTKLNSAEESAGEKQTEPWQKITVKGGDNLSLIFSRLAVSKKDLYEILSLGEETQSLKRLKPGQILRLKVEDSHLIELIHETDLVHRLKVTKADDSFKAKVFQEHPETKIASSSGSIEDSLFLSGQKAGLSDNVIMQMFSIFGWDIDFVLDIRRGDEFHIIYEELIKDGDKIKDGSILAAEFINRGKAYQAVRYKDSEGNTGYYTRQGQSMKKAFLRTPVNFTRISSHFNLKRKHPVLNRIRAHKGVDYAAPTGTPIKSTGKGKVHFAGKKNGYGNTVIIQHGGKYQTLYAHLSRFTRGLKKGQRIKQGQTIGYVGQSGLATGPHLHYEFRINGVHHNPLTVNLPKSLPLPKKYMGDFKKQTSSLLARLDTLSNQYQLARSGKQEQQPIELVETKLASIHPKDKDQQPLNSHYTIN